MVDATVDTNFRVVDRWLADVPARQIPFATAKALTDTAKDVQRATTRELDRALDNPTAFTKRAIGIKAATKRKLVARVFIKPAQATYLGYQIDGGTRLPRGRAIVVPVQQRVNKHGNLPRNTVKRLLARPDTFSGKVGGVAGIWRRRKTKGPKLLLAYEPKATYRRRYNFEKVASRTINREWQGNFDRALRFVQRTARR